MFPLPKVFLFQVLGCQLRIIRKFLPQICGYYPRGGHRYSKFLTAYQTDISLTTCN